MRKSDASLPVKDVVVIAGDIHCKSAKARKAVLAYLSEDYEIKDCSKDAHYPHDGHFATLKKQDYCKCELCGHLNSRVASRCHGYTCEGCKEVIYKEYVHRGQVKFSFLGDNRMPYLTFMIHHYDMEKSMLYVYAKPQKARNDWFSIPFDKVPAYLESRKGEYEETTINGKKVLGFYLPERGERNNDKVKISISEVRSAPYIKVPASDEKRGYRYDFKEEEKRCRYTCVQIYKGKEYEGDMGWNLPVADTYSIYPTYKRAPIPVDERLCQWVIHTARQVADCGYYYQDGRQAFTDVQLEWMALAIEHFTTLDADKFRKFCKKADLSGPGFICSFALWVEKHTKVKQYVQNKPNMFNAVLGIHKALSGERLTNGEVDALHLSLADREVCDEMMDLYGNIASRRQAAYNPLKDKEV
jgi:hypothetical protein